MHTTKTPLAEIAVTHPSASRVFHNHRLDYCCGGKRPLDEACRERHLDPDAILRQIEADADARARATNWATMPLNEVTAEIVSRFHDPLRLELPALVALASKVEAVHADKPDCPRGLAAHLREVHDSVLPHLDKEEQILFPMINAGHGPQAFGPIHMMEDEHHEHAENLRRSRKLAHDFIPPEAACTSWRALYLRLDEFEADLMEHIHIENNVLFPRALCG